MIVSKNFCRDRLKVHLSKFTGNKILFRKDKNNDNIKDDNGTILTK